MEPNIDYVTGITLLQERLKKLEQKSFDWSAWKKGTLLVIKNIFGEESYYYNQFSSVDYEYNSWSLRDTSGSGDPVKSSFAELINICMIDLKSRQQQSNKPYNEILVKYLPSYIIEEFKEINSKDDPIYEKEEKIKQILIKLDHDLLLKMMASIITNLQ